LVNHRAAAAGGVTQPQTVSVIDDDSTMEDIQILSGGGEKDQITAENLLRPLQQLLLRDTGEFHSPCTETGHHVEDAIFCNAAVQRRNMPNPARTGVLPDPLRHVVIPPSPCDFPRGIADFAQCLDKILN